MKTPRELQISVLVERMVNRLRDNPDALRDRVLRDFETMGDMQLMGVAQDLDVNFQDDEIEDNQQRSENLPISRIRQALIDDRVNECYTDRDVLIACVEVYFDRLEEADLRQAYRDANL